MQPLFVDLNLHSLKALSGVFAPARASAEANTTACHCTGCGHRCFPRAKLAAALLEGVDLSELEVQGGSGHLLLVVGYTR